jgi:hypothetical protein
MQRHETKENKQSCGRPSPRDQNGLISHQILHLKRTLPKNPKALTTLEKLQTHKKPTMETSKSNNRNSHKNSKGNCIPRLTPGKLEKDARKKDPKIFHKRETGDRNPKLFSLQQQSSQNLTLIHTPPKTPSFIKDEGK